MPASTRSPFSYAVVRVVPRIERGEFINAGVLLHCRQRGFLGVRIGLDRARLAALAPATNADEVAAGLDALAMVVRGDPAAGSIAAMPAWERFDWLVAPSSTVIQCSETHTGLTSDPQHTLDLLFADLVAPARTG